MSKGKIYLKDNNIVLEFCDYYFETIAPTILKEIKYIKEFDNEGYFVIETNYGEEYLDLGYALEQIGTDIKILNCLDSVTKFEVGDNLRSDEIRRIVYTACFVLDGISVTVDKQNMRLMVLDLNNDKYKALFQIKDNLEFKVITSTFPDSKRNYQMLYYIEKNREFIREELVNA